MMLRLAASTLRGRWAPLMGAFVALALGGALVIGAVQVMVALNGAAHVQPERYRAAPIVVAGASAVRLVTGRGADREDERDPNTATAALDPALVERLAAAPGVRRAVVDRSFPVRLAHGSTVGHPWSARSLTPYRLIAGRAPEAADEVVATRGGPAARLGATPAIVTPAGPVRARVVGIAAASGHAPTYERPWFFDDAQAAALDPGVDAIGVWPSGALAAVRSALPEGTTALTGDRRGEAEQNPNRLVADGAISLMGIMVATVGFVAIFVVASTFALAIALRRRELGLLRAVGATPGQVRRLVLWEATILAMLGALAGAGGSFAFTPALADWMADRGLAPVDLSVSPSAVALVTGAAAMVVVAVIGAWLGARRASRVRPAEALRDASVDRGVMSKPRWAIALLAIGGAVALMGAGVSADIEVQLPLAFGQAVLLIVGLTMLAPVIVGRLVGVAVLPWLGGRGPGPMLVREQARTAVRRTAATAAPVLVAIGLTAALTSMVNTIDASGRASDHARLLAGAVVVTADGGLSQDDVAALGTIPGATVGATLDGDVRAVGSEGLTAYPATGVDRSAVGLMLRVPAIHGSLHDLRGDSVALGELTASALRKRVGQRVRVWLPDGTPRRLTVAAVLADGLSTTAMYLPRDVLRGHAGPIAATGVYLRLPRDPSALAALRRIAAERALTVRGDGPARLVPADDSSHMNRLALELILGVAVLYVLVSLASTAGVATVARRGELAGLRLAGATNAQVVRLAAAEALATTAVGAALGFAVTAAMTIGLRHSLGALQGPSVISTPWSLLVAVFAVCAAIAIIAVVATARHTQRRAPHLLVRSA